MARPYAEVIGDPVAHSKSPVIHGFWLDRLGLEGAYLATRVPASGLADYFAERRRDPDWRGCNVTVPHKVAALGLVDSLDGDVQPGAINVISPDGRGGLKGSNSDLAGFIEPLVRSRAAGRFDIGAPVVMVGAGGAARAALAGLITLGYGPILILNRDVEKARTLARLFPDHAIDAAPLDTPLPPAKLIVNTSTLGMKNFPEVPFSLDGLPADALVYDIVYAPLETGLLRAARERGLATIDGLAMLIGQAAPAFATFFGAPPPRDYDDELRALLTS